MAPESAAERFRRLVEKVFSTKTERIEDQIDFDHKYQHLFRTEYEALIKIVIATKSTDALDPLMKAYMGLHEQYQKNTNNVRFYRSDQLFEILVEQSGRVAIGDVDLFPLYAASIETGQPSPSLRHRFLALSDHVRTKVLAFLKAEKEKRRASRSILDALREEYRKRYTFLPQDDADLYDFDPYPNAAFQLACERQVKAAVTAWNGCLAEYKKEKIEALYQALDAFRKHAAAAAKEGTPKLLQIVKYLLDLLRDRREGGYAMSGGQPATKVTPGDRSGLVHELYSIACLQLTVHAAVEKLLTRNKSGFTDEEKAFFFTPIDGYQYSSNIRARFNIGVKRIDALFDQSKYFLGLMLVTHHHLPRMTLVNLAKIVEIQAFWKPIFELTERLKYADAAEQARIHADPKHKATLARLQEMAAIDVGATQGAELGKGPLRIGDIPGSHASQGRIKIVYVNPKNHDEIYVEVESLKPQLFRVNKAYIQDKQYGTRILKIHEATIGMVYVTQFQILIVVFLPVLIEGGFAALIYEVGIYFASIKVEEAVAKIDPTAGKVVGLLAQTFTPRPNFKPKVNVPAAEQATTVLVLDAAQAESRRSFAEILKAGRDEAPLIADFSKSTVAKAKDKLTDKVMTLPSKEAVAARLEKLPEVVRQAEPVTNTGLTFRTGGAAKTTGGTGRGGTPTNLGNSRLAKSEKLKQVESYYELLTKEEALLAKKEVNAIFDELNRGVISYSQASQRLTNVLNGAKEVTGEYIADGVIHSNFKVIKEIAIPRRKNGVPMLDKVYKVKNPDTGAIDFLLVEVKGGEATRLGKVTAKQFQPKGGTITVTIDPNRMVKQGTGEWFYQKMVEIFEAEAIAVDRATAARMQREFKELAREMFAHAKSGKLQTAIIKSGRKLDPYVKESTAEAATFFQNIASPFPK
jgi:hypothetical protein